STSRVTRCRCTLPELRCGTFGRRTKRSGRPASGLTHRHPNRRSSAPVDRRAAAFARLFEAVHEGVYIGAIAPKKTSTVAANPHLRLIFGYAGDVPEADVLPFDTDRVIAAPARPAM